MAHHKSAKKSIRQTETRTLLNRSRKSRVRNTTKALELVIAGGNKKDAAESLKVAQRELDRSVSKGVINKKTAARKVSRLNKAVKKLAS
jgi:small subunit ribosomal protein S20